MVFIGEYYVGPKLIEEGQININIYHIIYFTLLLKENLAWCIMMLFLPPTHVLQKKVELVWHLRKQSLRKAAIVDAKHNLQKVSCDLGRCWGGDHYLIWIILGEEIMAGRQYL